MNLLSVMIVDDEPFIAQGLSVLIDWQMEGYEIVKIAGNGYEALEYLKEKEVDLIITDIKMPVMNGLELLEIIKKNHISDAYFTLLSGYRDFSYARQAMRNECMDYLLKPVEKEELVTLLRKIICISEKARENEQNHNELELYTKKSLYSYEGEIQASHNGIVLCKDNLDTLIEAIEQGEKIAINKSVEKLFDELKRMGDSADNIKLNINYLLFQLIHLATEQDNEVDQEKVLHFISASAMGDGMIRGNSIYLSRFACEYADYLRQLRRNASRGVLLEIEKEIKENYAENLTLRKLSEKYYINSSYLGQIFRKKYGQSFKDYLNNHRINEASKLLLKTDKKMIQIAEDVGYKDSDYFIRKFIELKGCTPSRYRKNQMEK